MPGIKAAVSPTTPEFTLKGNLRGQNLDCDIPTSVEPDMPKDYDKDHLGGVSIITKEMQEGLRLSNSSQKRKNDDVEKGIERKKPKVEVGGPEISGQEHQLQNGRETFNPTTSGPKRRNDDVEEGIKRKKPGVEVGGPEISGQEHQLQNGRETFNPTTSGPKRRNDDVEEGIKRKKPRVEMGGPEISGQEHQLQNGREAFNPTTSGPKQRNNDVKKHKKNKLDSRKYPLRNSGGAYDRKISGQKSQYDYEEEDGSTQKEKNRGRY
ncbi:hypothetical protein K469DRAFT_132501 [Zopfia rhizophila CBS 207.26]|uniref:Uncharacterized protein n=1 Tax=Zopfia rhizophila CBS 207.26 TaxID=1314779 RepID=A0A6A6ETV9_9PEZI|nr:hypothetical protein K469DRAFT_132501 [Zopfia rhizophila CBS 207.26]